MVAPASPPAATQRFVPTGSHRELFTSRASELLGAGPAGTGKTFTICWRIHLMALRYPGSRHLMTRKDLESLKPAALTTYVNGVEPHVAGVLPFGGNKFTPAEYRYPNGSVIQVNGLDRPEKVKSAEYDTIYVNEATEIPESTWEMLKSRLRNNVMPYQQIIGDCNPAGPRHWIRRRALAGKTHMVTSTHKDNPTYWDADRMDWTPIGRSYVLETLGSLSGVEYDRLYLGKWAASHGLVYPEFSPEQHIRPTLRVDATDDGYGGFFEGLAMAGHLQSGPVDVTGWRTVLGIDVGSRNPTAILVAHVAGDGRVHVSRELYRRNMSSSDILAAIKQFADDHSPDAIYIDPSARGYIDDLTRDGYPAEAAVNDILVGIQRVHSVFQAGFSIDESCTSTIDEFGLYAYHDNPRIETDKPKQEDDHAMDALRYLCMGIAEHATAPTVVPVSMEQQSAWEMH